MILTWVMIYPSMCKHYDLFPIKIATQFALFSEKFTRLTKILHDRRSHRSRQISTLGHSNQGEGKRKKHIFSKKTFSKILEGIVPQ